MAQREKGQEVQMSNETLKPCPVESLNAIKTGTLAKQLCLDCPRRKPISLEALAKRVEAKDIEYSYRGFERGYNEALVDVVAMIRDYEREINGKELNR